MRFNINININITINEIDNKFDTMPIKYTSGVKSTFLFPLPHTPRFWRHGVARLDALLDREVSRGIAVLVEVQREMSVWG